MNNQIINIRMPYEILDIPSLKDDVILSCFGFWAIISKSDFIKNGIVEIKIDDDNIVLPYTPFELHIYDYQLISHVRHSFDNLFILKTSTLGNKINNVVNSFLPLMDNILNMPLKNYYLIVYYHYDFPPNWIPRKYPTEEYIIFEANKAYEITYFIKSSINRSLIRYLSMRNIIIQESNSQIRILIPFNTAFTSEEIDILSASFLPWKDRRKVITKHREFINEVKAMVDITNNFT